MKTQKHIRNLALATSIAAILALAAMPAVSQAADGTWTGTTSSAWLTGTNWSGSVIPGSTSTTTNTDIATFGVATQPTVGINMNTTGGVYYLGAFDYTNSTARNIGNSSGTVAGVLTLNAATVNSVASTIIRNTSTGLLTIQANQTAAAMGLALGNTTNVIQITNTGGITISSNISQVNAGSGLTLQGGGTGTLTLSGTNTYGGGTTLTTGTLKFAKTAAMPATGLVAVGTGATLAVNAGAASGEWTNGTSGNGTIGGLLAGLGGQVGGTVSYSGNVALGIDTTNAVGSTMTYSGVIGNVGTSLGITKLGTGTLVLDQANTYTGPTTITTGTLQLNAGGVIATPILNNATFAVNSAGAVTQGTNFGLIGGTGAVTNAGAGTLTLNLANTHSGLTTATAGTIALTNALAIRNSALVTTSGTTTYSGGAALTIGGLSGATGDLGSASVLDGYTGLVTALTLNTVAAGPFTYGGIISNGSGTMSLTKTGTGTQILTGANSYTGATNVNQGTLTIGVNGSLNSSSALQMGGGTFSYGNTSAGQTVAGLAVGAGNSTVSNTAAGQTLTLGAITRTASIYGTVNFATLTGNISTTTGNAGSTGIIGPWATTGSTTSLRYAVGSSDGSTPTDISAFTTGTTATAGTLANVTDSTVNYEYSAAATTAADLTGNTLRYSGGTSTTTIGTTNTLTLNGLMQAGTNTLTINGHVSTGGIRIGSTGELVITSNAQTTIIGAVIGGTGRLVYSGAGTLTLGGSNTTIYTNTYTGGTVINSGTLQLLGGINANQDSLLGAASGGITLNGGKLLLTGVSAIGARIVTVNGVGSSIVLSDQGRSFRTSGKLTGAGTLGISLNTAGTQTTNDYTFSSTANDFTGRLSVGAGVIINVNSFADGSNNIALNTATFNYGTGANAAANLSSRSIEMSGSTGGATINNNNTASSHANTLTFGGVVPTGVGNKTLTLGGTNTGNNTISGSITDGSGSVISLTKAGAGTWVLSAANTYTGTTTVSGGTLEISGSISGSEVVVNGGTLSGNGGTTGAVTVAIGGTIAPGSSIGTLNTGALAFTGGAFGLEINTTAVTSDLANVAGNLSLAGGATLNITDFNVSGTPLSIGQVFTFIDYSGTWDGGVFAGRADDSQFTLGLNDYRISYNGVDNATSAVTLQVVPEPGSAVLLLGGLAALVGIRRRRG